jgi:hypothetical protein
MPARPRRSTSPEVITWTSPSRSSNRTPHASGSADALSASTRTSLQRLEIGEGQRRGHDLHTQVGEETFHECAEFGRGPACTDDEDAAADEFGSLHHAPP